VIHLYDLYDREKGSYSRIAKRENRMKAPAAASDERTHNHHRTIDRVVRILEEVVHRPGTTFGELARILEMPKSSLHGFVKGLLANGWLHEQQDGSQYRLFLGPGVYSLILTSGQIRAGMVSNADLHELQEKVRAEVYLGVLVGDQLVYVAEAGSDPVAGFHPRHIIRRELLQSAGGKALLASKAEGWLTDFLRRRPDAESDLISEFLSEVRDIRNSRVAKNYTQNRTRYALASVLCNSAGKSVASVTVVGSAEDLLPRQEEIAAELLKHIDIWQRRDVQPREAI
jgi:DNA-binding IclR family transcriptional regulator